MMRQDARFRWWAAVCKYNIVLLLITLLFVACSGGETGTGLTDKGSPGGQAPNGQQLVIGEITGFGSIFVNGIEFDTGTSTVRIGKNQGSESDLAVGMVVAVYGNVDADRKTGTASLVAFDNEVEGEVLANDYPASLNVMGQTVIFDNDTVFESKVPGISSIKDIRQKDRVEVSGFPAQNGTIYATRIKLTGDVIREGSAMVKGKIESLSLDNREFYVGGMPVSYDAATAIQSTISLQEGLLVKVSSTQPVNGNQPMYAEQISVVQNHGDDNPGTDVEMEGVVSSLQSDNDFQLNGVTVRLTETTVVMDGFRSSVGVGQKLRVRGNVDADNVLVADEVDIINTSNIEITAPIQSIDYMYNTVTVLGQLFHVNSMTIMQHDRQNPSEAIFNLAHLSPGDVIEIKGYPNDNASGFTATSLERNTESQSSSIIKAAIDDVQGNVLQLGPFSVDISKLPPGQFKDTDIGRKIQLSVDYNVDTGALVATAYEFDD